MTSSRTNQSSTSYCTQLREALRNHFPKRGLPLTSDDQRLRWTPRLLAVAAVLMAWLPGDTLQEAFAGARETIVGMYPTRRRPGKHLEGFLKTLQRHSATLRDIAVASLRVSLQQLAKRQWRWRGWVVLGVDGSRINCPRTNENKKALGCAGREKTGPQLLLTTVYHIATGVVWSWRRGGSEDSERAQLRDMLCELPGNTLLVADAGFVGYDIMQLLKKEGHSFVIRVGSNMTLLQKLGYACETHKSTVYLWPGNRRKLPPLTLRWVLLERDGKKMALLTNVDRTRLSDNEIAMIYAQRWGIEVMYRSLKQTMGKRSLRSGTPERAKVELDWAMIGLWMLGLMAIDACGLKQPWSTANALKAVRKAIRRGSCLARPQTLKMDLRHAIRDHYKRSGSKKAHDWPHKKREKPPGIPKLRMADDAEVLLAQKFRELENAA